MPSNQSTGNNCQYGWPNSRGGKPTCLEILHCVILVPLIILVTVFLASLPLTPLALRIKGKLAEDPVNYWAVATGIIVMGVSGAAFLMALIIVSILLIKLVTPTYYIKKLQQLRGCCGGCIRCCMWMEEETPEAYANTPMAEDLPLAYESWV